VGWHGLVGQGFARGGGASKLEGVGRSGRGGARWARCAWPCSGIVVEGWAGVGVVGPGAGVVAGGAEGGAVGG